MADYFDVVMFKQTKTGKTFAVRLGSASARDDGGFNLYLDAIPAPQEGQYKLCVVPRRERAAAQAQSSGNELNDEIPF